MNPPDPYRPDSPKNGDILLIMPGPETPRSRSLQEQLVPVRRLEHIFDAITALGVHTPADGPPCRAVIVTAEAMNAAPAGAADALRMVDPGIAIVGLGLPNGRGANAALDAELPEDASAASILGALGLRSTAGTLSAGSPRSTPEAAVPPIDRPKEPAPPAPPVAPVKPSAATPSAVNPEPSSPPALSAPPTPPTPPAPPPPPAEERFLRAGAELLEHLLAGGGNAAAHAMDLLRTITDRPNLILDERDDVPGEDETGAIVTDRGRCFGVLRERGRSTPPPALWAQWLARQLSLTERLTIYRDMAYHDDLTGAWNRRYMHAFLEHALAAARRLRRPVTIMLFDIDDLKHFNDEFGHQAGDLVLRETVALLSSIVRRSDRVCRIGGDEFLVIMADLDEPSSRDANNPESVESLAERFYRCIRTAPFCGLGDGVSGSVTVSAGLATFPWDALHQNDLLRIADERLRASKNEGKGRMTRRGSD